MVRGFFLKPNEAAVISATGVNSYQKRSFTKAKCIDRYGLEKHSFLDEEPFQTSYSVESCIFLCYAKYLYKQCRCHGLVGFNMTQSYCIHDSKSRMCLFSYILRPKYVTQQVKNCLSKCLPKCKRNYFRIKVSKIGGIDFFWNLKTSLGSFEPFVNDSLTVKRLFRAVETNVSAELQKFSENFALVTFYFPANEKWLQMETIEKIPFSTFLSNIGGLIGIWMGISAIGAIEKLENIFTPWAKARKNEKREPVL